MPLQPLHSCRSQNRGTSPVPNSSPSSLSPPSSNSSITFTLRVEITLLSLRLQPENNFLTKAASVSSLGLLHFPGYYSVLRDFLQFNSVTLSCPTLCDPMDCITQASLSITNSQSSLKLMSIESVMPSNHLILCRPLFLPPSVFPSIPLHQGATVLEFQLQHQSFQ